MSGRPRTGTPWTIERGDLIRVKGWPGTKGKTFMVKQVDPYTGPSVESQPGTATVQAWEVEKGGTRGKLRAFPASHCVPASQGYGTKRGPTITVTPRKEAM